MNFKEFTDWFDNLDLSTITVSPTSFLVRDFNPSEDFAKSMFYAAEKLFSEEDIVVRYAKPYTEDKKDVLVQFQILRSKSKIFFNALKKTDAPIIFMLSSNKEIKESVKFFNSLGVKGENMESLSSKEIDYTDIFKTELECGKEKGNDVLVIKISIGNDNDREVDYPMLSIYSENSASCGKIRSFNDVKALIKKEILKIEE